MVKTAKKVSKAKKISKAKEVNKVNKIEKKTNKKLIYIVSAFIILIVAGIFVYHFYNIQKIITPSNQNISQNTAKILNSSSHSYNSPFPLYIQGFKKVSSQLIPLSETPKSVYSSNLLNISRNTYINHNNTEIMISQLIYSNSATSKNIFEKITTIPKNFSSQFPNLTILKNLPANYYGMSFISNNKTIYSVIAQNNSKICSVFFDSETYTSNTVINLLENTTQVCFKV